MGAYKEMAIGLASLGYNPATVTLADLERRPRGETEAGRLRRLAAKAIVAGCQVWYLAGDTGRFAVTSATYAGTAYVVDTHANTCTCEGFAVGHRPCQHLCLVWLETGELLLPDAEPVAAA